MVLHNPNNWHWVNKDTSTWAKEYLEKCLVGLDAQDDGVSAMITKVVSMEGDVDVSQRKGKVITLFDVNLNLDYSGSCPDEKDVSGSINIPEVAHDSQEDEFVFDIEIHDDKSSKQPVKELVRTSLIPQMRKQLVKLGPALMEEHGQGLQHAPGSEPPRSSTPVYSSSKSTSGHNATTTTTSSSGKGPSVNTTKLTDQAEFRTSASELYQTFTDPQRIAAFTRAPPKTFEGAKKGGRFELFGGNVAGEYVELDEPIKIVQKWRLTQWPAGHFSTLNIKFDQNNQDNVTVMRVDWDGVPVGQEEVTKRNWGEYYVRSIKTTFGFGTVL